MKVMLSFMKHLLFSRHYAELFSFSINAHKIRYFIDEATDTEVQ